MMTDTIIANLPPEGLRSILRSLLGVDPKVMLAFQSLAAKYLESTKPTKVPILFGSGCEDDFNRFQGRYRCLMGCGKVFESFQAIGEVIKQARERSALEDLQYAAIDSDLVQGVTALQKALSTVYGPRTLTAEEQKIIQDLKSAIDDCRWSPPDLLKRGRSALETVGYDKRTEKQILSSGVLPPRYQYRPSSSNIETTTLGRAMVPRIFMGLWQLSSSAWSTWESASFDSIQNGFKKHIDGGFIAYGRSPTNSLGLFSDCTRYG